MMSADRLVRDLVGRCPGSVVVALPGASCCQRAGCDTVSGVSLNSLVITGQQSGLPGGGVQGIGPFSVACSGVQDTQEWVVNTSATVPVPTIAAGYAANAAGVLLIPPSGGSVAWSFKTTVGDTGIHGDQTTPTFLNFDAANQPANIYLTSASSVIIVVQFI